jgi:hypothetical protein
MLEKAKQTTRNGKYTYVEYARYADDLVILVDAFPRQDWLLAAVNKRLREELAKLHVQINEEKSRIVELGKGKSFGFLGFEFRRVRSRKGAWRPRYAPKLKKRTALLEKLKDIFRRFQSQRVGRVVALINPILGGGVTVFSPLAMYATPTGRVGIVGIGGLGHMAVKFAVAWGCDVTAFTSSESKFDEARGFGAHHVVSSRDSAAIKKLAGTFDLLIVTVNAPLDWDALVASLAPGGRLHFVGFVPEPIRVGVVSLIMGQRSISGSPIGSPVTAETMLDFAARHGITPQTEHFPMSRINEAFERLDAGKARYRIILDADF